METCVQVWQDHLELQVSLQSEAVASLDPQVTLESGVRRESQVPKESHYQVLQVAQELQVLRVLRDHLDLLAFPLDKTVNLEILDVQVFRENEGTPESPVRKVSTSQRS